MKTILRAVFVLLVTFLTVSSYADEIPDVLPIECDNIGEDGIGSAYEPHVFSVKNEDNIEIENPSWRCILKTKSGHGTLVYECNDLVFPLPQIENLERYKINPDGDIAILIEFEYDSQGIHQAADVFRAFLGLKPQINPPYNICHVTSEDGYYDTWSFNVDYTGRDYLTIEIQEEYDSAVIVRHIHEPYTAHVNSVTVTRFFYAWVTLKVTNEYGSTTYTYEIPPSLDYDSDLMNDQSGIANLTGSISKDISEIKVYNLQGHILKTCDQYEEISADLAPGFYVIVFKDKNDNFVTKKMIVK